MSYKQKYKSDVIDVTTTATQIVPKFDMSSLSIYPTTGAVSFRVFNQGSWGEWIQVPSGVSFDADLEGGRIEVKSATGTVSVNYFIKGLG